MDDLDLMNRIEERRLAVAGDLDGPGRAKLGQVFTPARVARFIAGTLGGFPIESTVRLLDPGAGVGSLTAAAIEHLTACGVSRIQVVAVEIDPALLQPLRMTLGEAAEWAKRSGTEVAWEIREENNMITK